MLLFHDISHRLALQFTAFVFGMLMITGIIFLAADFGNAHRQMNFRLQRSSESLMTVTNDAFEGQMPIPPHLRERVRIIGPGGDVLYSGGVFTNVPFFPGKEFVHVSVGGEGYRIFTRPVMLKPDAPGFVQIAEAERFSSDLPARILLYLMTSTAISVLTFFVGLFFARRSLLPAEQAMMRLEQFTQDASHELRTPIATINSSLDLALKTGKYEERILSAKQDLKHMVSLVERLLELARLDRFTLKPEGIDVASLVRQSVEVFTPLAEEKDVRVEADIKTDVTLKADSALVRQVLDNLLSNALKFSSKGGVISVKLSRNSLWVKDTGSGIDEQSLPRIFDRFYQADDSRANGGFGLGLALVKRIADLHGWTIDVKSKPGQGSEFRISFGKTKS